MRNLKRVLSLGMTAAMISGLMVSAGAAGYTDVTKEDNVEAIEVLQAVGIMVGDESGKFNPDQNVTRNEMAVIMANLMDYRVATFEGTSPFTDVPSWAEPYVAACYTNGIVAGTSATTFGGNDTVTAGQAALMLMKALGYFQYQSDFGSDWLLATTQVGTRINLFSGVEAGVREAMTRNDVAQLVLNTLESTMVDAENNSINVSTGDVAVTMGNTKYYYRVQTDGSTGAVNMAGSGKYIAINDDKVATGIDNASGQTLELGEELYEGDLKKSDGEDAFGRSGDLWTYGRDEIGLYLSKPVATYNGAVTKGELWSLVGKYNVDKLGGVDEGQFKVYADGELVVNVPKDSNAVTAAEATQIAKYFDSNSTAAAGDKATNGYAGNGVLTEVYLTSDYGVKIVQVNTYVARALADYDSTKKVLNVEILTNPVNSADANTGIITSVQLSGEDLDVAGYKAGDYILCNVVRDSAGSTNYTVEAVSPAKVVTGKVTAYSQGNYVTLDGTKYEYGLKIEGNDYTYSNPAVLADSAKTEYRVGDTASVVVDANGYVLYVANAAISLGNYLFIDDAVASTGLAQQATANAYFHDGTKKTITIDEVRDVDNNTLYGGIFGAGGAGLPNSINTDTATLLNGWYSYSINDDGSYILRQVNTGSKGYGVRTGSETTNAAKNQDGSIIGGQTMFYTDVNGKKCYGNDNTVMVVKSKVGGVEYVNAYVGVKNFPSIYGGPIEVGYMYESDDNTSTICSIVYVDASDSNVTIEDGSVQTTMYLGNKVETYVDTVSGEEIDVFNAVITGDDSMFRSTSSSSQIQIKAKKGAALQEYTLYTNITVDANGFVSGATKFDNSTNTTFVGIDLHAADGDKLFINGNSLLVDLDGDGSYNHTYVVTSDTDILLMLYPTGANQTKMQNTLMSDSGAKFEAKTVSASYINSILKNYKVDGKVSAIKESSDSNALKTLIVTVNGIL